MATLKELKELMAKSNLTDQQIAELISTLTSMQKANEGNSQAVSLPLELLELLRKCTSNRGANLVCPKCGSLAVTKNGRRKGRQRYFCKDCKKTFGDTYGTLLYHSRLSVEQWKKFLALTLYNVSLPKITRDMGINQSTAWYNRHKVCSLIQQLEGEQDSFPSIVEGDEFYTPLSFIGKRDTSFFFDKVNRMPRHHRNKKEKYEYIERGGYEVAEVSNMVGFKNDNTIPSALTVSKELNGLKKAEKRKRGISNEQVCVLTAVDKLENRYLAPSCVGKIEPKHLEQQWNGRFAEDSILVTDSLRAYRTFANKHKIHLRQIPSGKHSSGVFNLGKVNSYHSNLSLFLACYREVASKYIDHYLALFRWQEKFRGRRTTEQVELLLDMLTRGVDNRVLLTKLKDKPMPFDTKGLLIDGRM